MPIAVGGSPSDRACRSMCSKRKPTLDRSESGCLLGVMGVAHPTTPILLLLPSPSSPTTRAPSHKPGSPHGKPTPMPPMARLVCAAERPRRHRPCQLGSRRAESGPVYEATSGHAASSADATAGETLCIGCPSDGTQVSRSRISQRGWLAAVASVLVMRSKPSDSNSVVVPT